MPMKRKYICILDIYISNSVRLLKRQATGLIQSSSAEAAWMPATRWAWLHSFSRFLMRCDDLLHIKAEATPRALCGVAMIFTCPTTEWEWAEAEAGNQWLWLWWVCDWVWVSVRVGVWVWVSVWVSGCVSGCECAGVSVSVLVWRWRLRHRCDPVAHTSRRLPEPERDMLVNGKCECKCVCVCVSISVSMCVCVRVAPVEMLFTYAWRIARPLSCKSL